MVTNLIFTFGHCPNYLPPLVIIIIFIIIFITVIIIIMVIRVITFIMIARTIMVFIHQSHTSQVAATDGSLTMGSNPAVQMQLLSASPASAPESSASSALSAFGIRMIITLMVVIMMQSECNHCLALRDSIVLLSVCARRYLMQMSSS